MTLRQENELLLFFIILLLTTLANAANCAVHKTVDPKQLKIRLDKANLDPAMRKFTQKTRILKLEHLP